MRLANQDWDLSLMEGITEILVSIMQYSFSQKIYLALSLFNICILIIVNLFYILNIL